MNRDWYNAPLQGGSRSAHDYGNSGPIEPITSIYPISWRERIATGTIVAIVTLTLVAFWPS